MNNPLPQAVADLVTGKPGLDEVEQAFPLLTTDPLGFPHVALLSRAEIEVNGDRSRVLAALASTRTRKNLLRTGRATVVAISGTTAHYAKLALVAHLEAPGLLGCEFSVEDTIADSLGIDISPIMFRTSAELAQSENWVRAGELLDTLLNRPS